jgi:hypothetical protein
MYLDLNVAHSHWEQVIRIQTKSQICDSCEIKNKLCGTVPFSSDATILNACSYYTVVSSCSSFLFCAQVLLL